MMGVFEYCGGMDNASQVVVVTLDFRGEFVSAGLDCGSWGDSLLSNPNGLSLVVDLPIYPFDLLALELVVVIPMDFALLEGSLTLIVPTFPASSVDGGCLKQ